MRTGSHGSAGRLGRRRLGWTPGSTAGHGAVTERCGGGWAASPSAPSRRRTAWGSVTAPRIRRGPPQRDRPGPRSRTPGAGAGPRPAAWAGRRRLRRAPPAPAKARWPLSSRGKIDSGTVSPFGPRTGFVSTCSPSAATFERSGARRRIRTAGGLPCAHPERASVTWRKRDPWLNLWSSSNRPRRQRRSGRFLGSKYRVEASYGHIRDLPESAADVPKEIKDKDWGRLGVDVEQRLHALLRRVPRQEEAGRAPQDRASRRRRSCCWPPTPIAKASRSAGTWRRC